MYHYNPLDQINSIEKSEYRSLLTITLLIQVIIAFIFIFIMYSMNYLKFNNIISIISFPLSEHFNFLLNSLGLILSILGILIFLLITFKISKLQLFVLKRHKMSETEHLIGFILFVVAMIYGAYESGFSFFTLFDFSYSITIKEYWNNLKLFFEAPGKFIILSDEFYYYLEFTSWILLIIFLIKNILIYAREKKHLSFKFYQFKSLLFFVFLVILLNIIKTYYVLFIHPTPIEYFIIISLITLLNGIFENINMSLSVYSSIYELKKEYKLLFVALLCLFLSIGYMFTKIIIPEFLSISIDMDLIQIIIYSSIILYLILLYPIVKFYYLTNLVLDDSKTVNNTIKSYFIYSLIIFCTLINFKILFLIDLDNSVFLLRDVLDNNVFTLEHVIDLIFSLIFSFTIIYFTRLFSNKEIIIFISFIWIYFLTLFNEIIVETIIYLLISSIFFFITFLTYKIFKLIKNLIVNNRNTLKFHNLNDLVSITTIFPIFMILFLIGYIHDEGLLDNYLTYLIFWIILFISSFVIHYLFKFCGRLIYKFEKN